MSEKDISKKIIQTTEKAVSKFVDGTSATETTILNRIKLLIRNLEVDAQGNIKPTVANIKATRAIKDDINSIVLNEAYLKKVDTFIDSFAKTKGITDQFFKGITNNFNPNKLVFKEVLNNNVTLTRNSLTSAGINENVIKPILDLVNQSVTSGGLIQDLENDLTLNIKGDKDRLGGLERYSSQITRDALNQYSRNYNESVSSNLGLEWYYYSGSIIQDTRTYCKERAGKYFHKKEVQKVPSQWNGRIPGTNSSSIFIYAGGYNCRHIWMPVLIDVVPKTVIRRNISSGNYKE